MKILYECKKCGWQGTSDQLECDIVESCMGADEIEMCPECGHMDLKMIYDTNLSEDIKILD